MKYPDAKYYREVKDKQYKNLPTEKMLLKLREEPKCLRTQNPVQNQTQIRKTKNLSEIIMMN